MCACSALACTAFIVKEQPRQRNAHVIHNYFLASALVFASGSGNSRCCRGTDTAVLDMPQMPAPPYSECYTGAPAASLDHFSSFGCCSSLGWDVVLKLAFFGKRRTPRRAQRLSQSRKLSGELISIKNNACVGL